MEEIPGPGGGAAAAQIVDELSEHDGVGREKSHLGHLDEECEGVLVHGLATPGQAGENDRASGGVRRGSGVGGKHPAEDRQGGGEAAGRGRAEQGTELVVKVAK